MEEIANVPDAAHITIPDSADAMASEMSRLSGLINASEWERAAIVYAFTTPSKGGRPAKNVREMTRVSRESFTTFAERGFTGLTTRKSVAFYYRRWQWAIDQGLVTETAPGMTNVELPDISWTEAAPGEEDLPQLPEPKPERHQTTAKRRKDPAQAEAEAAARQEREAAEVAKREQIIADAIKVREVGEKFPASSLAEQAKIAEMSERNLRRVKAFGHMPQDVMDWFTGLALTTRQFEQLSSKNGKWTPEEMTGFAQKLIEGHIVDPASTTEQARSGLADAIGKFDSWGATQRRNFLADPNVTVAQFSRNQAVADAEKKAEWDRFSKPLRDVEKAAQSERAALVWTREARDAANVLGEMVDHAEQVSPQHASTLYNAVASTAAKAISVLDQATADVRAEDLRLLARQIISLMQARNDQQGLAELAALIRMGSNVIESTTIISSRDVEGVIVIEPE